MSRLLIATNNAGKVSEIKAILGCCYKEVVSLADLGLVLDVKEDGDTFEQNAVKKAQAAAALAKCDALADDSGLCVDMLGGAPGVYSARYAGESADDVQNNIKLMKELEGVENRAARFVCVAALAAGNQVKTARGEIAGEITHKLAGSGGFGYDPLFFVPEYGQTFAQLPLDIKNSISHRARALAQLKQML